MSDGPLAEALHPVEIRVLGSLIEKQLSTPEYYPLTMNALIAACNQKSNRDPVMQLDLDTVEAAIRALRAYELLAVRTGPKIRKEKYAQRAAERLEVSARELAVLCELMLRGPQAPGALRTRCARMAEFNDIETAPLALEELAGREPPLVVQLPRASGRAERRWAHLLGDAPVEEGAGQDIPSEAAPARVAAGNDPIEELRAQVQDLAEAFRALEQRFDAFRAQFE